MGGVEVEIRDYVENSALLAQPTYNASLFPTHISTWKRHVKLSLDQEVGESHEPIYSYF